MDIDGTLADCEHRRHHVEKTPKDWTGFFADMNKDQPNDAVKKLLFNWPRSDRIILVTGRGKEHEPKTMAWLSEHGIVWDVLYMRPAGDYRPDTVVKLELYDQHIKGKFDVLFVLDDRKSVVDMWRSLGLQCWQVAEGNF